MYNFRLVALLVVVVGVGSLSAEPMRVACIGDSITFGYGLDAKESYPAQLQALLGADYDVRNFGNSGRGVLKASRRGAGWRAYLKQKSHLDALAYNPTVVICNLGINDIDACRKGAWDRLVPDYIELIRAYQALPSKPTVFIWTKLAPLESSHRCYDWEEPFVMRLHLLEVAQKTGAIGLDMFSPLFKQEAVFLKDGIHPNEKGCRLIAKATQNQIESHLSGDFGGLKLPYVFADHMVLQRDRPIPIWGTANRGVQVRVSLDGDQQEVVAGLDGQWRVDLPRRAAGGPHVLRVESADKTLVFFGVLVGEVWVSAGQSNMRWAMKLCESAKKEIPNADFPKIRLLNRVGNAHPGAGRWSAETLATCTAGRYYRGAWAPCSPKSLPDFSGVSYYFAKRLHAELGVPIGMINIPIGGTIAEAFTSEEALLANARLRPLVATNGGWLTSKIAPPWPKGRASANLKGWLDASTDFVPHHPFEPSFLFDAAIRPITQFPIRGVIWYQGESNASISSGANDKPLDQAYTRAGFETLISDWRKQFGQPNLPFLYVQLPNLNRPWMQFREMQLQTLRKVPHTGMAVTIDVGDPSNVHPRRKAPVGNRLAGWALHDLYGKTSIAKSGPLATTVRWDGPKAIVSFEYGTGLTWSSGHRVVGFELAGADGNYVAADATVLGDQLIVSTSSISKPTSVRYAWAPNPVCNLVNGASLPASPFRLK